jgi:hypothetical protein
MAGVSQTQQLRTCHTCDAIDSAAGLDTPWPCFVRASGWRRRTPQVPMIGRRRLLSNREAFWGAFGDQIFSFSFLLRL